MQTRVGARVRDLRLRRGWTQEALGERSGLSYKFIGEIERGLGNPTIDSVAQIAKAFAIDVSQLFDRDVPEVTYAPLTPDDFAVVREARESLNSIEDIMKRLDASAKTKAPKKPKSRRRT